MLMGLLVLALSACGSYQNTTDVDGIYGEDNSSSYETQTAETAATDTDKNNYYKQYFKTKSQSLDEIPEDDVIFTDIDAYSSYESMDDEGYVVVEETGGYNGYAGWGENTTDVAVNVYGGYGGWGGGWGWGIGFGWGWGSPYWGWGGYWGYPYYGWGGYWGWYGAYNPWYYHCPTPYYYNNYHYNNGGYAYSYNRGRRNSDYLAARSTTGARSYANSRTSRIANRANGRYSRSEMARRSNVRSGRYASMRNSARGNSRYGTNNRSSYRNTRSTPNARTNRSTYNRNTNRNNYRSNRTTRPSTRSYSRPSSGMRSSGGSYRGGGGRAGGGRAGGGRGGRG